MPSEDVLLPATTVPPLMVMLPAALEPLMFSVLAPTTTLFWLTVPLSVSDVAPLSTVSVPPPKSTLSENRPTT